MVFNSLPLFDFGLSLRIYFSCYAINNYIRKYYGCLFKLFKFKFHNHSVIEINRFLPPFGLNSFHHRLTSKLSNVAFKILNDPSAPVNLKYCITTPDTSSQRYDFRPATMPLSIKTFFRTTNGQHTFNYIFSNYLNKFRSN